MAGKYKEQESKPGVIKNSYSDFMDFVPTDEEFETSDEKSTELLNILVDSFEINNG